MTNLTLEDKPTFSRLPPTWQNWIIENIGRGCAPVEMANSVASSGQFDIMTAKRAIAEAMGQRIPDLGRLPTINTTKNTLTINGQKIDILMALKEPNVVLLGNVMSDSDCDVLVRHCENRYTRATVADEKTGAGVVDEGRTSSSAAIQRGEQELADSIEERLSAICQWPVENSEPFQLQRYAIEQQYRPHFDTLTPGAAGHRDALLRGGQRLATFILYLTDVEQGGSTIFPALGLEVFPKKGSALFFINTDENHQPNPKTLHGGAPVVSGTKIVANKWLRQERFY